MSAAETLNRALSADVAAIHSLICNRVPCNKELAEDPYIVCEQSLVIGDFFTVNALGLINGILTDLGQPNVVLSWSDDVDSKGRHRLLGFKDQEPQ